MTGSAHPISPAFALLLLIWHAMNYLFSADPTGATDRRSSSLARNRLAWFVCRGVAGAILAAAVCGWSDSLPLDALMFGGCLFLPIARWRWIPPRYVAEWEIGANLAFAVAAYLLLGNRSTAASSALPEAAARYVFAASLLIFVCRGGTYIVRGVLDRAGTMPPPEMPPDAPCFGKDRGLPVDTVELNHGRLIGNIERLALVLLVANGQYTALAFFFAAKGLIRSRDIERRAWADYLILGSLTSFLVAIVAGLLIQAAFRGAL